MDMFMYVPQGLEKDLSSEHELVLFYEDGKERKKVMYSPMDYSSGGVRLVLRPFLEVKGYDAEGLTQVLLLPLESVRGIEVDHLEDRPGGADADSGEEVRPELVSVPVARWVCHPDKGLVRFVEEL